jgi:hypothetical protein
MYLSLSSLGTNHQVPCKPTSEDHKDANGKVLVEKCDKAFIKRIIAIDPADRPSETEYVWAYGTFDGKGNHVAMADGTFGSLVGNDVVDSNYAHAGTIDNMALLKATSNRQATPESDSLADSGSFL